jgi:L-ascorbate metabolism protein UlaG (beta-lactamase superfamily)
MYFSWYGQACFKIQNGDRVIIFDPYGGKRVGLRRPQLKGDIFILKSEEEIARFEEDGGEGFVIVNPGEYEIGGIFIIGIKTSSGQTIFLVDWDGVKIGYLGEIKSPLKATEIENLGELDVLILPVGNKKTVLSPKEAVEMVEAIEPAIIIPCCYHLEGLKINLESLEGFCKEMGIKAGEKLEKFYLKKGTLNKEKMQLVVLKPA